MTVSTTVHRIVISVAELAPALVLYRDVLGLTPAAPAAEPSDLSFLRSADGVEVMLHRRPVDRGDAAVAVCFAVADLGRTVQAWAAAGGVIVDPPARQPWGEDLAVVRDIDGHIVCLRAADV